MAQRNPQVANWCFTLNLVNVLPEEHGELDFSLHPQVGFAIWQLELGENGNEHFQGFIQMKRSTRRTTMLKIIPRAHFEEARSVNDSVAYCSKEEGRLEGPWEYGQLRNNPGKRTDLVEIKALIDAGRTENDISDNYFGQWVRYHRSFREYKKLKTPPRDHKTAVILVLGPPGTGKTRYCRSVAPAGYWKNKGNWWDGYDRHDDVVLDEFTGWIPFHDLNRLCDRYPLHWEIKGAHTEFVAKRCFFTSNELPHQWYEFSCNGGDGDHRIATRHKSHDIRAFARRVDCIIWIGESDDRAIFTTDAFRAFYEWYGDTHDAGVAYVRGYLDGYPVPEQNVLLGGLELPPAQP